MTLRALVVVALVLGCGGGDDAPDARPGVDAAIEGLSIVWAPCDLRSEGGGADAECASVVVPARWDASDGATITLFVKRRLARTQPARTQLWLLNGGPGGPGAAYEPFVELFEEYFADVDYYLLDHRGTGRSSRLGCPRTGEAEDGPAGFTILSSEWPACRDEVAADVGDRLDAFTTTEAAHDLGALIDATRAPGQEVQVHGMSYGTFWAQRYLQLFPTQPTAVSLLGIAPPDISFTHYDATLDRVGRAYLAACGADATCAAHLGADPAARIEALFTSLDAGHCPEARALGYDRATLRQIFASLIYNSWEERALVPAIAARLERCSEADVAALRTYAGSIARAAPSVHDQLESPVLGMHIGHSELWDEPGPTIEEARAVIAGTLFTTELGEDFVPIHAAWPRYTPDALDGAWATTDVPLLMLNGTLDPATPIEGAREVAAHFTGALQVFVELPGTAHAWSSPLPSGNWCALNLFAKFLEDPHVPLDLGCVAEIVPPSWEPNPELARAAFGVDDLW